MIVIFRKKSILMYDNHTTYLSLALTPLEWTQFFRSFVRTTLTAALNSTYFLSKSLPLATLPITLIAHLICSFNFSNFFAISSIMLNVDSSSIVDDDVAETAYIRKNDWELVLFSILCLIKKISHPCTKERCYKYYRK